MSVIKTRLIRTALLAGIGLLLGILIAGVSLIQSKSQKSSPVIMNIAGIGGPWELKDQNGKIRTDKDFAHDFKLIYFGFTSCPAVCPTELQKIAQAYHDLPKDIQVKTKLVFITIDPERDTPKTLKGYVALFDPSMIGLTGTEAQIESIKSTYKIYAAKVPDGDSYTIDHSSFIYYMTPDDKVITLFKPDQTVDDMKTFIKRYMNGDFAKP
jgi:protein SCO1/2